MKTKTKIYIIVCLVIVSIACISYFIKQTKEENNTKKNQEIVLNNENVESNNANETTISPTLSPIIPEVEERTIDNLFAGIDMSIYKESGYENIKTIVPEELYEKIDNKETFILYIGKTQCKWCSVVAPILNDIDYNTIPIYYLNTGYYGENYPKDENSPVFKEVKKQHQILKETLIYTNVPSFRYVKDGEVIYGMGNPLPGSFFEETATEETKQQDKELCKNIILSFLSDIENENNGFTNEKYITWSFLREETILKLKEYNPYFPNEKLRDSITY